MRLLKCSSQNFWFTDLLLLTLLLSLQFGAFLGTRPLMVPDEARYSEIPREMIITGDYITPHINYIKYFEKPPLFYWLQTVSIKLFGMGNASLRLMTLLCGLLGCLLTYAAARKLYDRRTGWFAALILATGALYFEMSRYITLDMAVSFFLTGALFSFLIGVNHPPGKKRNFYMWGMYLFSAFATLTKGLIGIIFPGMIIFCWLLLCNNWRELKTYCLPSGIFIGLSIVLPWHLLVQLRNPEFFNFYIIQQQFARYLTPIADRQQGFWFFPMIFLGGFLPWFCFLIQAIRSHWPKNWQSRAMHQNEIFLLLWPLLIFLFFQFSHSQLGAYILPIFPPLAVLVGNYLAEKTISGALPVNLRNAAFLAAAIVFLGMLGFAFYGVWQQQGYWLFLLPLIVLAILIFSYRKWSLYGIIIALFLSMAPLLWLGDYLISVPIAKEKSIQSLALSLKNHLKPQDIVAVYHGYNQDLPFYLERRVLIAGWGNAELDFGMAHQNMTGWYWTDQELWHHWSAPCLSMKGEDCAQIFLFMSKNDYNDLLKKSPKRLYLIGATKRYVVVSNKQ